MLSLRERLAVINLYEELGSYRAVAALVGCDHKTVKAWLARERDGRSVNQRPRATDAYPLPLIRAKVAAPQGKIKSKPLLRVLRGARLITAELGRSRTFCVPAAASVPPRVGTDDPQVTPHYPPDKESLLG